jgi:ribose transport system permease protein
MSVESFGGAQAGSVSTDAEARSASGQEDPARVPSPRGHRGLRLALALLEIGPVAILVGLILVLAVLSDPFLSLENIGNVMKQSAVICVLALGQLAVIVTRGIDLSVGSTLSLSAVVGALVWRDYESATLTILAALATGAAVGSVNGLLLVKGRLPHPFIPTLATLTAASGLALYLSHSQTIIGAPPVVTDIGAGRISWIPGGGPVGWFPMAVLVVVGVALLMLLLTRLLVWGRWIYAVGGNPEAAVRNGIPVSGVLISVYVLSGLLAGVAALLTMGKGNAGSPNAGALAELDAIAAVIIGGASFLGGRGSVGNAITGALIIAVLRNGLNLLGIDPNWQYIATGAVIVLAVELDVVRRHLEGRFRSLHAAASS